MKCPNCGQEMESGYLNIFAPTGGGSVPIILVMSWKDDSKTEDDSRTEDKWWWIHGRARSDRIVDKHSWLSPLNVSLEAYKCEKCQYILFSYEKERREIQERDKKADYKDVEKHLR